MLKTNFIYHGGVSHLKNTMRITSIKPVGIICQGTAPAQGLWWGEIGVKVDMSCAALSHMTHQGFLQVNLEGVITTMKL